MRRAGSGVAALHTFEKVYRGENHRECVGVANTLWEDSSFWAACPYDPEPTSLDIPEKQLGVGPKHRDLLGFL